MNTVERSISEIIETTVLQVWEYLHIQNRGDGTQI